MKSPKKGEKIVYVTALTQSLSVSLFWTQSPNTSRSHDPSLPNLWPAKSAPSQSYHTVPSFISEGG